jgi:hypothetical protein
MTAKWEYYTVSQSYWCPEDGLAGGGRWDFQPRQGCKTLAELFDKLGLDGWELVSSTSGSNWCTHYFKRPVL